MSWIPNIAQSLVYSDVDCKVGTNLIIRSGNEIKCRVYFFLTFPLWQGSGGVPGSGRGLALAHPAGRAVQALPGVARPQDLARKF